MRLETAICRLPDDHRRVLDLRFHHDLGFAEIGGLMARSEEACGCSWSRAVEKLRDILEYRHDDACRASR